MIRLPAKALGAQTILSKGLPLKSSVSLTTAFAVFLALHLVSCSTKAGPDSKKKSEVSKELTLVPDWLWNSGDGESSPNEQLKPAAVAQGGEEKPLASYSWTERMNRKGNKISHDAEIINIKPIPHSTARGYQGFYTLDAKGGLFLWSSDGRTNQPMLSLPFDVASSAISPQGRYLAAWPKEPR